MKIGKQNGFTLIELLIVVAVIGILAAIAYPSYRKYVVQAKRVEVQSDMIDISARLQRYKAINSTFIKSDGTPIALGDIGHNGSSPQSGQATYALQLSNVTAGTWTLIATPNSGTTQVGNGVVCLNSQGQRYWEKDSTTCDFTKNNWD
ncbi:MULTISPECIES: type IV pilin protein [Acinetobacter]|uniref:Type IV pilin protein n=1 Tax=Acinetobacter corruptisaponis TaxID=3045147 RepID=A0ABY8S2Z7_9GAMM|nr:type IV pilin protein [Acinetobacter sp. KCTC 92772]WHP04882.1 type IV pilin protein [Acinetobacter sp. KCTC 92772]